MRHECVFVDDVKAFDKLGGVECGGFLVHDVCDMDDSSLIRIDLGKGISEEAGISIQFIRMDEYLMYVGIRASN